MPDIVLVAPEIPGNTGNIIRLSANSGARLHLVEPLGFHFEEKALRRAGLDYHDLARLTIHADWDACCAALAGRRKFALTTRGSVRYDSVVYREDDVFVFGSETAGLSPAVRESFPAAHCLRVPMQPSNRSLNLSNTVALVVYEAWRQLGFPGSV